MAKQVRGKRKGDKGDTLEYMKTRAQTMEISAMVTELPTMNWFLSK
jgi:hypothetical protein